MMDNAPKTEWMDRANCRNQGPEAFFPERFAVNMRNKINAAKALCEACEVKPECLSYALEFEPLGVWGGMTERERRDFRAKNRITMSNHFTAGIR
jgi:WhiB family redox-sensing transcriptional regulator